MILTLPTIHGGGRPAGASRFPNIPLGDAPGHREPPVLPARLETLDGPAEWRAPAGVAVVSDPPPAVPVAELSLVADEDLASRFQRLAAEWHEDTDFLSTTAVFTHSAYQEIIGMGPAVLPLLLRDLEETGAHWFWALRAITGENPTPSDARGDIGRMTEAWLAWGRERGVV